MGDVLQVINASCKHCAITNCAIDLLIRSKTDELKGYWNDIARYMIRIDSGLKQNQRGKNRWC